MRILLHCIYYPPEIGGLESHVSGLATGLVRRGLEVRVVTSRSLPDLPREENIEGVHVKRTWLPSRSAMGWSAHALTSLPVTRSWGQWADVIHAQSFASVLPVGWVAKMASRPWVASFHTSHFLARARSQIWSPILGHLVRSPDHALAASEEIAKVATRIGKGRYVEAVTNGVDTNRFRRRERQISERGTSRTILVPRRLFRKNGVEYLVRALPEIRSRIPGVRVLIIGDGPERPRLEDLAAKLGVDDLIQFLGFRPHGEMPALLSSGDIAVFPSLMEATSIAALEAMSCGLPVVASSVGGLPEIVDSEVGALVPPRDPAALARAVVQLCSDDGLRQKGCRGRERVVAQWSNERLVDRHLEIYRDLIQGRAVRVPSAGGES